MLSQIIVKPAQQPCNVSKFHLLLPRFLLQHHALTTNVAAEDATVAKLVLDSDPRTISETLEKPDFRWSPELVDKVLKRLWNHGPKALQFFKHLDRHPTYIHASSGFDHAIDIAARMRDYNSVWALVGRMRSLRRGPTPRTFAIITERYVSAGKAHRAVKVFLSMHEHGCRQDLSSFNTILDVLCKSRRVEMAYNLFKVFRGRFKCDSVSYNIIANGWCLIKRTPMALQVFKEMVERGITPTLVTYNILLKGYFRTNQLKEAWEFFLEMKKRKCEIDVVTYTTMVHGFGVAGEVKRSRRVFDEMVREGLVPSVATYNALIQVLCKKDSVQNAVLVFEEMVRKGCVPNVVTYNVVIRGLCHSGDMEKAVEFMGRMEEHGSRPNVQTYNVVIRYFCDAGEIEKGLNMFEKMGNGSCLPNLDTYNVLISAMFVRKKSDDLVMAGKLLIEMIDRQFLPRKFTFNRVLNGLVLTGNHDFAKEILRMQSRCGRVLRHLKL
ncbi:pentatricopeptide repeat-containing protein At1g74900, mitochondrial [Gastrolobium bilobum]|uniref:pentatricopeptide repeat-containing protein At1g74900, mitochondrial n=1 Tax=Gastrolobium bilobum TaxID=150636 RepID=UPI002AAF27D0|nr:pentatricopeptide repeat-containing protein At1g74900, mitochondrial [Gastrolobium bilobum]XP_061369633.1 pentatricopeptide repeat-containing protein At1g74900, mitochondrial [Gastrolobium bilobum]XP_061369634.1 pentatricopeptide repeat-containing protein At1g74900, mitochondrial [Gastrolobium bilobum]XP_061369635.1 pentatricopeptide repeat-containing protein At1g74900, mitochondrial [Gastrolobium bilobum]